MIIKKSHAAKIGCLSQKKGVTVATERATTMANSNGDKHVDRTFGPVKFGRLSFCSVRRDAAAGGRVRQLRPVSSD